MNAGSRIARGFSLCSQPVWYESSGLVSNVELSRTIVIAKINDRDSEQMLVEKFSYPFNKAGN
jgi:hypothetical protein